MAPKKKGGRGGRRGGLSSDEEFEAKKPTPVPAADSTDSESSSEDSSEDERPRRGASRFALAVSSSESDSDSESESASGSESESESGSGSESGSEREDKSKAHDGKAAPKQAGRKVESSSSADEKEAESSDEESKNAKGGGKRKSERESDNSDEELKTKAQPSRPQGKAKASPKKAQGKGKKGKQVDDDDLDALLEEVGASVPGKAESPAVAEKGKKGKKDKKEADDLDDLLAELESPAKKGASPVAAAAASPVTVEKPAVSDEEAEGRGAAPGGLTKNQLKKQKKKQAAQKKVAQKKDDSDDETKPAPPAKKGPLSAAARAAQERLRLLKEEEERQKKEEEERKRQEEEQRKREEEEEKRRQEERALREQRRAERKQRLKEEGKLLSSKEKKERERQQAFLRQLQEKGVVLGEDQSETSHKKKSSRAVDGKKKKKKEKTETPEDAEEADSSRRREEEPREEEKKRKEEEPAHENWEELLDELDDDGDSPDAKTNTEKEQQSQKVKKGGANARQRAAMEAAAAVEAAAAAEKKAQEEAAEKKKKEVELRSPIVCILGHVDTGKTKLLDKIRHTNVQDNEAGGITQQIGATYFPPEALVEQCRKFSKAELRLPGLLIIDTPGHSSFTNLRARGSSLCDLAIVVVDIMHGMEQQTRESLELLKQKKCPFIIALNKIDRLYGWNSIPWQHDIPKHLASQGPSTRDEFDRRAMEAITQLQEEGFNCRLYWENEDVRKNVSVVPTSAVTGEGVPDLLNLVVQVNQTLMQRTIAKEAVDSRLARGDRQLQCTILEVKAIDGLGTTIDVILVHGTLYEGDKIVVCGMSGPIVTTIRALLTPQPLKELRVKGEYIQHAFIQAAMGVKISAPNLEEAVAGTSVFVVEEDDDIEDLKEEVMSDMGSIFKSVDRTGSGVYVMASTLGSLEALLVFLQESKIPVFGVNIGTVQKKDVKKASIMREKGRPDLSVILAFNVKVDPEAEKEAKTLGVKIMTAEIIYHLFDEFTAYFQSMKEEKKKAVAQEAIFPCILGVLPQYIFNKKDPLILGVVVEEGILKVGTPLCVPDKGDLRIGRVVSLEVNKKPCDKATKGQEVCVKIAGEPTVMIGRHFDAKNKLVSRLTRDSIDCLKEHFRDEMSKDDWKTVIHLKKILGIQ
ncbi:putative translation initiation factor IF-2 [Toxoplasma gondii RUB]|uniref:Eukaryotic translation initiation factor 5B n=1 Tax=Toxoplasma gondii RUB TaxID=935652 RepID=A0A086M070_TOXGO|nr:putative translation initiation factor IF-2 [Toxoplasma gondii RUB]